MIRRIRSLMLNDDNMTTGDRAYHASDDSFDLANKRAPIQGFQHPAKS